MRVLMLQSAGDVVACVAKCNPKRKSVSEAAGKTAVDFLGAVNFADFPMLSNTLCFVGI